MSAGVADSRSAEALIALPVALMGFSAEGRLEVVSAEMLALLQMGAASLPPGMPAGDVLRRLAFHGTFGVGDPEQRLAEVLALDPALAHRSLRRDVAGRVLELRLAPLPGGGRALVIVEVTEHVQPREAADSRAQAAAELLSRLGTGVAQYDAEHRLALSNPAYPKLVGLDPQTLREGMTVTEIVERQQEVGELDAETARLVIARMAAYPRGLAWRMERTRPNGRTLRFDNQLMPGGGWLSEITDVTEKHTAEQEARRRIALHDALMQALPVGVAVYAADRTCTLVNPAYNRIMAHSPIEPGENLRDILLRRALEGEFGPLDDPEEEVRRRLTLVAAPYSFEQRLEGTSTVHRSVPLPDGGHAMVVADVTALEAAQAELRQRAELFRTMIESTRHGIAMFDASQRVIAANRLAAKLCGVPPENFVPGMTLEALRQLQIALGVHGGRAATQRFLDARRGREMSAPDRYRRRSNDGATIEVVTDRLPDGGFVRSYTDVTAQVAAEAEAMRRAATLQTVFDNMHHGIALFDAEHRLLAANALCGEVMGLGEALRPGMTDVEIMRMQAAAGEFGTAEEAERYIQSTLETNWSRTRQARRRRADGTELEVMTTPVEGGGFVLTLTDITARVVAEREVARRAEALAATLEAARQGITLFDAKGRVVAANDLAARIAGYPNGQSMLGISHAELVAEQRRFEGVSPEEEVRRAALFEQQDRTKPSRYQRRGASGEVMDIMSNPLADGGYVVTLSDVTEIVLARERAQAQAAALAATLDASRHAIILYGPDRRVVATNRITLELTGFATVEEMVGKTHEEVITSQARKDYGEDHAWFVRDMLALDRTKPLRSQRRLPDGRVRDIASDPTPDGGFVISVSDVTELVDAREEAQRRAGILQVMLENSRQGIALYDSDQRLVAANSLAGELMGMTGMLVPGITQREVLANQRRRGMYGPEPDSEAWERLFNELDRRVPHRIQRNLPDGRRLDISSDPTPDGGHVVSLADVTSLVRAEEAAEQRAGVLKTMLENSTSGIMLYDAGRRLLAFNAIAADLTEMPDLHARAGSTLDQILDAQLASGNLGAGEVGEETFRRLADMDRGRSHRIQRRTARGRALIVSSDPTPDGGFVISLTDISAIVRAEAEAARRAEILGVMLGNIRHGIVLFDRTGCAVASNAKLHELLELPESLLAPGTSHEEMVDIFYQRGEFGTGEAALALAERIKWQDRTRPVHSVRTRPNGVILEVVCDPTPDGGWVVTYSDVTEDRRVRAELEAARMQSEAASRAKSRFLATMSHELRTPLNAVIGFSEVLNGRTPPDQVEEFAIAIQEAGRHLLSLIDDILDVTRAESGSLPVVLEDVAAVPLLEGAARMIGAAAAGAKLLLATDLPASLPLLRADGRRLRQVVLNLLSNATKFTPAGGEVTLRARCETQGLVIEVRDTGIGIEAKDLARVFEPFTQIDSALARRFPGSGLGLHLCRALTEAQGATLELDSTPGIGTTARITFPMSAVVSADGTLPPGPLA